MDSTQLDQWREELYDLPPAARGARLEKIRAESPAAAQELAREMEHLDSIEAATHTQAQAEQLFRREDWTGTVIGERYEILRMLGEGGSAKVFLASQTNVCNREVVVKVLRPAYGRYRDRELEALVRLPRHAGVVAVVDAGNEQGLDYLVTERLAGESLADILERGPLPWHDALRITSQVAAALKALHSSGVYHRDVKPANIILIDNGQQAVLIDFGIAHLSERSLTYTMAAGTPGYMAPEQFQNHQVSPRTDVFALAVLMIELLLGTAARSEREAALETRLDRAHLPAHVKRALLKGCDVDAKKRHASPMEFLEDLQQGGRRVSRRLVAGGGAVLVGASALGAAASYYLAAPPLSIAVEPDPNSGLSRFRLRLVVRDGIFAYVFSGVEPSSPTPLTLLWPAGASGSGELRAGEHTIPPQSWNWFTLDREKPPHTIWLVWAPHVDPQLAMHSATGVVAQNLASDVRSHLMRGSPREVPVRWPAPGAIRLHDPGAVCLRFEVAAQRLHSSK